MRKDVLLGVSVYNEAGRVKPWLEHWTGLVDDIVIIDQDSADGTLTEIKEFIAGYTGECNVDLFRAPTLGMCEPVFNAISPMAAQAGKWMLKLDVDEWLSAAELDKLMAIAMRAFKEHQVTTVITPRVNLVDGVNAARARATETDPEGLDYQIRLSRDNALVFSYNPHTYPAVRGKWVIARDVAIEHRRTFSQVVEANIKRSRFLPQATVDAQMGFINRVAAILGLSDEDVAGEVKKHG